MMRLEGEPALDYMEEIRTTCAQGPDTGEPMGLPHLHALLALHEASLALRQKRLEPIAVVITPTGFPEVESIVWGAQHALDQYEQMNQGRKDAAYEILVDLATTNATSLAQNAADRAKRLHFSERQFTRLIRHSQEQITLWNSVRDTIWFWQKQQPTPGRGVAIFEDQNLLITVNDYNGRIYREGYKFVSKPHSFILVFEVKKERKSTKYRAHQVVPDPSLDRTWAKSEEEMKKERPALNFLLDQLKFTDELNSILIRLDLASDRAESFAVVSALWEISQRLRAIGEVLEFPPGALNRQEVEARQLALAETIGHLDALPLHLSTQIKGALQEVFERQVSKR